MQSRTSTLFAFTLGSAMTIGAAATAADLPKEGTSTGTYYSFGTAKATPVGKERVVGVIEENGLSLSNGFGDHVTWHCSGLLDITKGTAQYQAYCVGTDPDGDNIVADVASDGTYPADAKIVKGHGKLTTGTGKYTGISGGLTYVSHGAEFRSAAEGSYFQYNTDARFSYRLP
jgi:hypothetical protein